MATFANPREGAYQIHLTPYFRRLHRNDSAELERLKQAYEHVRNFDEKPIVAQVKNIRLGKLLHRIKDSLNSVKPKRSTKSRSKPKSREQNRREELTKAGQIGMEYSRQNFGCQQCQYTKVTESYKRLKEWENKRSRLECRLKYGNEKSQENRNALQQSCGSMSPRSTNGTIKDREEPPIARHLRKLRKKLPNKDFLKYIFHCLSVDNPDSNFITTVQEILKSDTELYCDLQKALERRQEQILHCTRTLQRLFEIASKCAPNAKPLYPSKAFGMESFESTTYFKPSRREASEVYIRTYRYSDEQEELPLPTESFLKPSDDMLDDPAQNVFPISLPSVFNYCSAKDFGINPPVTNKFTDIIREKVRKESKPKLTDCATKNFGTHSPVKNKFTHIIRETVRKESKAMLTDLEKALRH